MTVNWSCLETVRDAAFGPPAEIAACTDAVLARHVAYCHGNSPFYRRRFAELALRPEDITCTADLARLPLTTKSDLEKCGEEFLCVPMREIVDICQTSGTTGLPVSMLQTENDLLRVSHNEALSFDGAGLTADDRVVVACALGRCFMAGLAYFEGLRQLGATVVRCGGGAPALLAEAVLAHRPTALVCVPSHAVELARELSTRGIEPRELGIHTLVCIGEPVRRPDLSSSALGSRLEALFGARVLGTYASTEMATAFAECVEGCGGHVHPHLMAVEIVDEQGVALPPGEVGEVVATPLGVTGMPLLRFRTGDIASLIDEPCACGRRTMRLGPVRGRRNHMLKIRGTTVYPAAVFDVLQEIPAVRNYYLEVYEDYDLSDRVRVVVGIDDVENAPTTEQITQRLRGRIRVVVEVCAASPDEVRSRTMLPGKRKPVRIFDHRQRRESGMEKV